MPCPNCDSPFHLHTIEKGEGWSIAGCDYCGWKSEKIFGNTVGDAWKVGINAFSEWTEEEYPERAKTFKDGTAPRPDPKLWKNPYKERR
jgi:hypothetical protein